MKKLIPIFGLLLCFARPASALPTLGQVKQSTSLSCSTPCTITTVATGAGHLGIVGFISGATGQALAAPTAGVCSGSWTHAVPPLFSTTGVGSGDYFYCLSLTGGTISISVPFTGASTGMAIFWEGVQDSGFTWALDSGATPSGNLPDAACTACAGVSLSLSANNKFIAVMAACAGTCSGLTGTGFTNDLSNPNTDGVGHGILSTSGTVVSPLTFTSTSAKLTCNALAFQETSAGGVVTGFDKRRRYESMEE